MYITLIIMFLVFFAGSFQIFAIGTYGVMYLDVFTAVFYVIFFSKVIWNNYEFKIPRSAIWTSMCLLILTVFLSGVSVYFRQESAQLTQYLKSTTHFIFMILLILISLAYPIKLEVVNKIIRIWLGLSILINVFGVYQIFARAYDLPFAWIDYNNVNMTLRGAGSEESISQLSLKFGNFYRATSIFSEPSALATFNCYIIILISTPFFQGAKSFIKSKRVNIAIFVTAIIGSLLTFSLTALVGIIMFLIPVLIFESRKTKVLLTTIFISSFLLLSVVDTIVYTYTDTSVLSLFDKRITGILNWNSKFRETTEGESFGTRMESANKSFEIWKDYPVLGYGFGLTQYNRKVEMNFSDYTVLAALTELGFLGAFFFTMFFITLTYTAFKAMKYAKKIPEEDDIKKRIYGVVFYLLLIQIEINFLTGNNLISPNLWLVILLMTTPIYHYLLETKPYISFRLFNTSLADKINNKSTDYKS